MKIKCVITDDETFAAKGLAGYVNKIETLELTGIYHNALELNTHLTNHQTDLIFLDIQMPYITGIEFLKTIKNPPPVVFTTAFSNYAIESYELNVLDYLLKPISFERFLKTTHKIQEYFSKLDINANSENYFFVKSGNKLEKIVTETILYIESIENYAQIYTANQKFLVHLPLKSIQKSLSPNQFIQTHKSYIVAIDKITSIEGNIIFIGKNEIPVGRNLKNEVFEKILKSKLLKKN